ncbi:MAG TPA: hypothetical protein VEK15_16390 [Vicinamibacteria bacterium]|nr:hypothetical protein [Vicinamibacteria bacterium]
MRVRASVLWIAGWLFACGWAREARSQAEATPFSISSVHFEQNATDGDVEVVFEVRGGADGLAELTIVSPDGRTVIDFKAPDSSTMGMRSFRFESPEPSDVELLENAYPEGDYAFSGRTFSGEKLAGTSTLGHGLPQTATFRVPAADAEGVPVKNLEISWGGVSGITSYHLELAQEGSDTSISAVLPGTTTSFRVPDGFAQAETEYQLSIGTVDEEGNISFVETFFKTGK